MQEFDQPVDKLLDTENVSAVTNFVRGFATSGIERPVNAVLEIADHVTGKQLPKLDIVENPTGGIASTLGSIAGTTADIALLSIGTGKVLSSFGVPAAGTGFGALRLGVTGAVYGSVFQPSSGAGNFWAERAKNGAIEGATWATIGAASSGMVNHGVFAQEGMRSLTGSIMLGATSGGAGGLVHANATTLLREGRLASLGETDSQVGQFAVSGAAFGAMHHVGNQLLGRSQAEARTNEAPYNPNKPPNYVDQVLREGTGKSEYATSKDFYGRTVVETYSSSQVENYPGGLKVYREDGHAMDLTFPRGTKITQDSGLIKGVTRDGATIEVQNGFMEMNVRTKLADGTEFFFKDGKPIKAALPDGRTFVPYKANGETISVPLTEEGAILPDGTRLLWGGRKILPDGTEVFHNGEGKQTKILTDGTRITEGRSTRTIFPDRTMEVKDSDGFAYTRKADGTEIIKGARGGVKIKHPDGTVEKITQQGVRTIKPWQGPGQPEVTPSKHMHFPTGTRTNSSTRLSQFPS